MSSSLSNAPLHLLFTTKDSSGSGVEEHHEEKRHKSSALKVRLGDGAVFWCPASMLRGGCRSIPELLENANGEGTTTQRLELPLLTLDSTVFSTVAIYLEHFYGPMDDPGAASDKDLHQTNLHADRPTILSGVLQVRELYHLSEWEHLFVVQQLLAWPQDRWELSEEGNWVDVSAAEAGNAPSVYQPCLQQLLNVLEAATTLDIPPLKNLCGTVLANMLLNLDEQQILELTGVARSFGPEEERALLKDYPWLNV